MTTIDERLTEKIEAATGRVNDAMTIVRSLLAELQTQPRAQKMMISAAIEDAVSKLRAARAELADLEQLLVNELKPR